MLDDCHGKKQDHELHKAKTMFSSFQTLDITGLLKLFYITVRAIENP